MDIATKKIELIEWLARLQDEGILQRIEALKKKSQMGQYEQRIPKTLSDIQSKLEQSESDISSGNLYSQHDVEERLRLKFKQ